MYVLVQAVVTGCGNSAAPAVGLHALGHGVPPYRGSQQPRRLQALGTVLGQQEGAAEGGEKPLSSQQLLYFQPLELGQLSLGTGGLLFWGCLRSSLFIAGVSTAAASANKRDLKLPSRHEG